VAETVQVRHVNDDEGQRLLRIIRRGTGPVVTWRRVQMLLLSAQGMPVAKIAEVSFTSADRVRDVIHNFDTDGFDSLYPKYKGDRPKTFPLPERREIKKIAKSKPPEHDLPFSTWGLTKLTDCLVAEGVVDDIRHEGLRIALREERLLSTPEDLEDLPRSGPRSQEGPGRAPLRPRRRRGHTRGRASPTWFSDHAAGGGPPTRGSASASATGSPRSLRVDAQALGDGVAVEALSGAGAEQGVAAATVTGLNPRARHEGTNASRYFVWTARGPYSTAPAELPLQL
jgi:transposase